jgi:hypothetical protein
MRTSPTPMARSPLSSPFKTCWWWPKKMTLGHWGVDATLASSLLRFLPLGRALALIITSPAPSDLRGR